MVKVKHYLRDGAGSQARAVMAFLQDRTIEDSYNDGMHRYDAEPEIARWENGREQGYIISLVSQDRKDKLNIAFFEHRNSDAICAIRWKQWGMNNINIDTADFGTSCYSDKYDVNKSVGYGEVVEMADWIWEQFEVFWNEGFLKDWE